MKYLFSLLMLISIFANAQTARVGVAPCFQLSDSLGTAVTRSTSFQPYEPEPYWYMPAKADVGYYYANAASGCSGKQPLRKPIVIIDGFDAGDKRRFKEIYNELNYNGGNDNFVVELQAQGYDVVVVNFPKYQVGSLLGSGPFFPVYRDGGADYIERNADALLGVILMLKDELVASGSTEQLTIVGTSMAGLISRYTLAYMEKMHALYPYNGWQHNTKLWISFDAPHNGANIPIAAQEFLRYWAGEGSEGARDSYKNKINSPATRQLLLHHNYQPITGFPNTPQVHSYRSRFMTALQNNGLAGSNGYPMNLRKVAVANGSQAGATTGYDGQMNLEMDLHIQAFNGNLMRVGGSRTYTTRSYGGSGVVSYAEKSRYSFWTGITNHPETRYSNGTPNSVSYDIAPGGIYDVYDIVRKEGLAANPSFIGPFNSAAVMASFTMPNAIHCFIPTKSALGFTGSNQDLGENLTGRSLVCTGETPFNAYYAPIGGNEAHAKLNQNSVDWLKRELGINSGGPNGNPPPTPPSNFSITINRLTYNTNCVGAKQTYGYTIPAGVLRSGDIVTSTKWFVTGSLQIDGLDNQATVVVAPTANTGNVGTVRVEITTSNFCIGKGVASLDVYSALQDYPIGIKKDGAACPPPPIGNPDDLEDNSVRTYSLDVSPAYLASIGTITSYSWTTTGGLSIIGATNIPEVTVAHTSNGTISLEITSNGLCRGKGRGTLSVKVGVPVMLSSTTLDISCISGLEAVFAEDVTSITLLHFKPTSTFPGIVYPTTTGRLLFTEAGRYRIFATNDCGNSIIYNLTIISTPDNCQKVGEIPTKADILPEITVSPNPANTYLDVSNILAGSEVKIYTKIGVLVHSQKSENDKIRLDISKLSTDLYILEAVLPNNIRVRKQIVKE